MNNITIERTFTVPVWDEIARQKVLDYWANKRFKFIQSFVDQMLAKRGRWLGNLISSDMTFIKATLSIQVVSGQIHAVMELNTRPDSRSEWEMAWWNLEMRTFESFLLRGDEQKELWKQFKIDHKAAILRWSFNGQHPELLQMSEVDKERYLE